MKSAKHLVKTFVQQLGYDVRRIPPSRQFMPDFECALSVKESEYYTQWSASHPLFTPWAGYPEFQEIYQGVEPYTLVSPERCYILMSLARYAFYWSFD